MLRRAQADDVEAVASLFRRSFGTLTFLPTLHTPEEDRRFFAAALEEQEVWVWEEHGRVLGFASLGERELHHLYVEPEAQGRGIGGALLEHAQARRPAGVELWVFQQNARARRLYERRGFRLVRETDGSGNEERTPDALYAWDPEPGPGREQPVTSAPRPRARRASGAPARSRAAAPRSSPRRSR